MKVCSIDNIKQQQISGTYNQLTVLGLGEGWVRSCLDIDTTTNIVSEQNNKNSLRSRPISLAANDEDRPGSWKLSLSPSTILGYYIVLFDKHIFAWIRNQFYCWVVEYFTKNDYYLLTSGAGGPGWLIRSDMSLSFADKQKGFMSWKLKKAYFRSQGKNKQTKPKNLLCKTSDKWKLTYIQFIHNRRPILEAKKDKDFEILCLKKD